VRWGRKCDLLERRFQFSFLLPVFVRLSLPNSSSSRHSNPISSEFLSSGLNFCGTTASKQQTYVLIETNSSVSSKQQTYVLIETNILVLCFEEISSLIVKKN